MHIFPAIDLYGGKAVRLYKGDYDQMTVYSDDPASVAADFAQKGAAYMHIVDLEGAKTGQTPNLEVIKAIVDRSGLFIEVGGGIRSIDTIRAYLSIGVNRVILGTAAVTQPELVKRAVELFGDAVAVGADVKDGLIAIKGWVEKSEYPVMDFCKAMDALGVRTIICTDISKDGAMGGTNRELYSRLSREISANIVASGGVSTLEDIRALKEMGLYGAIVGKAYYTGAIDLARAIEIGEGL